VQSDEYLPTFRTDIMPSSSRVKQSNPLEVKAIIPFKTSGTTHPKTESHPSRGGLSATPVRISNLAF
jgi:hypothetical protein